MDDLLIMAEDWDELIENLREVFQQMRAANLTLRLRKCSFGLEEIDFLGYTISKGIVRPGEHKSLAIRDFPTPQNTHQIRQFLGLANYFRRFIPRFAELSQPLTELLRKEAKFEWKERQDGLAGLMLQADEDRKLHLVYCVSKKLNQGLAGLMLQADEDRKLHLVYCVSKKLTMEEKRYHSTKLELMAIVWTITKLRSFLIGIPFQIVTDCQVLVYMHAKKTVNPQIARWYDLIMEFVQDFGLPERIISDRGTAFTSKELEEFCGKNGIVHVLNSSRHPQANGMVERVHRTIIPMVSMKMKSPDDRNWDQYVDEVVAEFNATENKSTRKSPFQLLYGYQPQ
ncbi:RNase H-like domain found in reverse transcriptase [Popillia japonica]|uniref:RNA-directed DNA polymerase n=1 Tax=Popillia japonica TaxID=7064 RepID=A0AAW1KL00_POPJA